MRQLRRPLRDQRGLPLAAQGDEGEDMGSLRLPAHGLVPGVGEELGLRLAADEVRRGVFVDAGDVGLEGGGFRYAFLRCLVRGDVAGGQRLDVALEGAVSDGMDLKVEDGLHRSGGGGAHRVQVHGLLSHRNDVPAALPRHKELAPHPVVLVGAAVQRAGSEQQKKVRPLRDLCEDLFRPLARIDAVDIQEDVVAPSCERPFDQPRKKVARRVPPVTDEDGLLTHALQARVASSTAAQHGTEISRVGAEAQARRRFSTAPSSESFGRERRVKGRNFNGSLQRVPSRRTGRGEGSRRSRGVTRLPASWLAGAPSLPTEAPSAGLEAFRLGPSPPSLAAEPRSLSRRASCPAVRLWNLSGKARSLVRTAFWVARKAFWVVCKAFCLACKAQSLAAEPRSLVSTAFELAHEAPVLRGRRAGLRARVGMGSARRSRPGSNPPKGRTLPAGSDRERRQGSSTAL